MLLRICIYYNEKIKILSKQRSVVREELVVIIDGEGKLVQKC